MIPDNNNEKLNRNTEITMVYKCVLDVNVTCTYSQETFCNSQSVNKMGYQCLSS